MFCERSRKYLCKMIIIFQQTKREAFASKTTSPYPGRPHLPLFSSSSSRLVSPRRRISHSSSLSQIQDDDDDEDDPLVATPAGGLAARSSIAAPPSPHPRPSSANHNTQWFYPTNHDRPGGRGRGERSTSANQQRPPPHQSGQRLHQSLDLEEAGLIVGEEMEKANANAKPFGR